MAETKTADLDVALAPPKARRGSPPKIDFATQGLLTQQNLVALKQRRIFYPNDRAMQRWDSVMMVMLLIVMIVTPFEVGFLDLRVNNMFWFNRLLDLGFLVDIG